MEIVLFLLLISDNCLMFSNIFQNKMNKEQLNNVEVRRNFKTIFDIKKLVFNKMI